MQTLVGNNEPSGVIRLQNESLTVSVLPVGGANICSIVDRRTGRDWLWRNPHIPLTNSRTGNDYGATLDSGGWDEVLLSISPESLQVPGSKRRDIPDHGVLVRRAWRVSEYSADMCETRIEGQVFDFELSRRVQLSKEIANFSVGYELTNNESFAWPMYWCAHALFNAEQGTRIELSGSQPYRIDQAADKLNPAERQRTWPLLSLNEKRVHDLSDSFSALESPVARKLFVNSPTDGQVAVTAPDGQKLTMGFDETVLPWIGIWINNEGWSGCASPPYRNLGVEPSTAAFDSVGEAIDNDAVAWIAPGETRRWSVQIGIDI